MTAVGALARLALRRLLYRPLRSALLASGLALAAAMLAASLAGGLLTQDRAARRAIARLPAENRSVNAVWGGFGGLAGDRFERLDPIARRALRPVLGTEAVATLLFRQARVGGTLLDLGAVGGLARWVRLRSGRLPRSCRPEHCEVLHVAGPARAPDLAGIEVVGAGELVPGAPLQHLAGRSSGSGRAVVLLAGDVAGLAGLADLATTYRTYAWVVPLASAEVHVWRLDELKGRLDHARVALQLRSDVFEVTAPEVEVEAVRASARVSGRRLLLVAGQGVSLLLAFSLLAAIGVRREFEAGAGRLRRLGARRGQALGAAALEVIALAAGGVAVGWSAGCLLAVVLARTLDTPAWPVLVRSALSGTGALLALGLVLAASALVLAGVRARALRLAGLRVSPLDAAGATAAAVVVLELARGSADPERLAGEAGSGLELLLLPPLVALAAAALCVRVLLPALGRSERAFRRGQPSTRLALLWLARSPAHALVAVGFLVTSLGLALFAETYRATLARNLADQAAFAVPADFVLREDLSRLVSIQRAAAPRRYAELGRAYPVIRASGEAARVESGPGLTVLGVPAGAIPELDGWRADFSATSRTELARRLRPPSPAELRGVRLPASARELVLPVTVRGDSIALEAAVRTPRGDFEVVDLGEIGQASSRSAVRGLLPAAARGGSVVALTLDLTQLERFGGGHRETGDKGARDNVAVGTLTLGRLRAVGPAGRPQPLRGYAGWLAGGPVRVSFATARGASLQYALSRQAAGRFRPRQPTDGSTVSVLASPRLAAAAGSSGRLPLRIVGEPLTVRVVGTIRRFPTVLEGDTIVADSGTLETALNAQAPGTGVPGELWLRAGPRAEELLARPPFDALEVTSRRATERDLRADPLARGTLAVLLAAALVALGLAATGIVLALVAEVRDRAGELADLEAEGLDPAAIRRQVYLRAGLIAALGAAGGAGAGALLSTLVVGFVALTAGSTDPVPPLVVAVDWSTVAAGAVGLLVLTSVVVVLVIRRALSGEDAPRVAEASP